jgi:hypothetical protein
VVTVLVRLYHARGINFVPNCAARLALMFRSIRLGKSESSYEIFSHKSWENLAKTLLLKRVSLFAIFNKGFSRQPQLTVHCKLACFSHKIKSSELVKNLI